jgi:hypothetical protein
MYSWKQGVAKRLQGSSSGPLRLVTLDNDVDVTDSDYLGSIVCMNRLEGVISDRVSMPPYIRDIMIL